MHRNTASTVVFKKTSLAAAVMLLASWCAAGTSQAQTWKSHVSASTPDAIYRQHCMACHGEKGDGKTMAQYALDPPPENFTSEEARSELSRAHMIEVLNKGSFTKEGKATGMIAWKSHLSREQIEAVVDYVIVKFMDGKVVPNEQAHEEGHEQEGHEHEGHGHEHHGHDHSHKRHDHSKIKSVDYPYGLKPNMAHGQSVYSANCAACHGGKGDGHGDPARMASLKPRNFHDADFHEFATGFTLFSAVSRGRGHMPSWEKTLSTQEIADVSEYVLRTFVKPARVVAQGK
jgi:mono/diheme cytochrome c family protein